MYLGSVSHICTLITSYTEKGEKEMKEVSRTRLNNSVPSYTGVGLGGRSRTVAVELRRANAEHIAAHEAAANHAEARAGGSAQAHVQARVGRDLQAGAAGRWRVVVGAAD